MSEPPDFIGDIDELDPPLAGSSVEPEEGRPESSTMPERIIYLVLQAGVEFIVGDPRSIRRMMPFTEERELTKIEQIIKDEPLRVIHGYARIGAEFPLVSIVLGKETEASNQKYIDFFLGSAMDDYDDAGGEFSDVFGSGFEGDYHLHIIAQHPDVVTYWYHIVRFILMQAHTLLSRYGIIPLDMSGRDIRPAPEYLQEFVYQRVLVFRVQTQQVFADHSPLIDHINLFVQDAGGRVNPTVINDGE